MKSRHPNYLLQKEGTWHFFRRVPKHMEGIDKRTFVKKATKIKVALDPEGRLAAKRAAHFNDELERDWHDMIAGKNDATRSHLRAAAKRATQLGFTYHTASEVTSDHIAEILKRFDTLRPTIDQPIDQTALMGGGARASILLSGLTEEFYKFHATDLRDKAPGQIARWREDCDGPVNRLIKVIGDKDILDVSREDAKTFRQWWSDRIMEERKPNGQPLGTEGARKDINRLGKMIRIIAKRDGFADPEPFRGFGFKASNGQRIAFAVEFVRDVILKPGALKGMQADAFDILMLCIETGARVSEVVALNKRHIHLDGTNIPFVSIRADGRELKTKNSARDVPLVGVALEAMRRNPNGFPQWFDKGTEVAKLINKWLRELQSDVDTDEGELYKTLYCIRHTFKDRLRNADAADGMMLQIMGHDHGVTGKTPKYGVGYTMEKKLAIMSQIAFAN